MGVHQTRLENIERLARDRSYKHSSDFCDAVGMSSSYFSQLKSGGKKLGTRLAAKIEHKLGLEAGFLDKEHTSVPFGATLQAAPAFDPQVMSAAYALQALPADLRGDILRLVVTMTSLHQASKSGA